VQKVTEELSMNREIMRLILSKDVNMKVNKLMVEYLLNLP
jgi:hypothetical protein